MRRDRLRGGAAALCAWGCLSGLALVRLWAVLGGRVPGRWILAAAVLLAGGCVYAAWRLRLWRYLRPFGARWKNALLGGAAFALGALLDMSYALFEPGDMAIGLPPFRLLCALGSGLVFCCAALILTKAVRDFGPLHREGGWGRAAAVLVLVVNIVTALYSAGSAKVYYWDSATYWELGITLAEQPLGLAQLRTVLQSVITSEYNYLLALPISLVMRVLGTSRYVYLFATVNLYALPALLGMLALGRRTRGGGALVCCAAPMLLYTALVGFVDVAAAGAGIWAFVIYTAEDRPQWARGVLSGALLTLVFLLRRYFFFLTVSFAVSAAIALCVRRGQWKCFTAFAASGLGCSLYFGQSFVVDKVLSARYADVYSGYDLGRWVDAVMICRYFGYLLLLAVGLGLVWLLLRRPGARYPALLCLVQPLLCLFLFTRVQSHGQQHLLLYLPAFCAGAALLAGELPRRLPARLSAWALALSALVSSFLPWPQPSDVREVTVLSALPTFTYQPSSRGDIAELIALRIYVDNLSAEESKTASIIASSFVFNDSIYDAVLRSLNIPEPDGPRTTIVYFATVDKRDAFSWAALEADYLLVADPVQTHLGEDAQRLVTLLARPVLEGTGIGTAYEKLDVSFPLDDGVTVYIYRRTRDVTAQERQEISDALIAAYPDYAQLYAAP